MSGKAMSTGRNEVPEVGEVYEVKEVQKRKDTRASGFPP
jgi:hypothetical protein